MKKLLFIIISFVFVSCAEKDVSNPDFKDKIIDLVIKESDGQPIEFPEIYDSLVSDIPEDKDEKLILVEKLKSKGFKIATWTKNCNFYT